MSEEIFLPFERKLNIRTDVELLGLHLTGQIGGTMSDKLQELLSRLETCRDLYRKYKSQSKTVNEMASLNFQRVGREEKYQISLQTAYRDFDDAITLFNITFKTTGLNFHVDSLLSMINKTWTKAHADNDWKTAAQCERNYMLALEKFFGNLEAERYKNLQPGTVVTDYLPEESKVPLPQGWEKAIAKEIDQKRRKEMYFDAEAEIIEEEKPERSDDDRDDTAGN